MRSEIVFQTTGDSVETKLEINAKAKLVFTVHAFLLHLPLQPLSLSEDLDLEQHDFSDVGLDLQHDMVSFFA